MARCLVCKEVQGDWAYYKQGNVYCLDCAFKKSLIGEREYLEKSGVHLKRAHVAVCNGDIVFWIGSPVPPWERTLKQNRYTKEYIEWRRAVFEQDHYTCQICGQVGGELNAHHILEFAKHEKARYKVSNGQTLCTECHRKVHRRGNENVPSSH